MITWKSWTLCSRFILTNHNSKSFLNFLLLYRKFSHQNESLCYVEIFILLTRGKEMKKEARWRFWSIEANEGELEWAITEIRVFEATLFVDIELGNVRAKQFYINIFNFSFSKLYFYKQSCFETLKFLIASHKVYHVCSFTDDVMDIKCNLS